MSTDTLRAALAELVAAQDHHQRECAALPKTPDISQREYWTDSTGLTGGGDGRYDKVNAAVLGLRTAWERARAALATPQLAIAPAAPVAEARVGVAQDETAWLVEWKAHGHGPQWWGFNYEPGKRGTWCSDANNAVRFARKVDAERMRLHIIADANLTGHHEYERSISATEHIWPAAPAAAGSAEPASDGAVRRATAAESAELDAKVGLVELPPIRIPVEHHAGLLATQEAAGLTQADEIFQRPATLLEELDAEAALVPNRRGKLYALAAEEIRSMQHIAAANTLPTVNPGQCPMCGEYSMAARARQGLYEFTEGCASPQAPAAPAAPVWSRLTDDELHRAFYNAASQHGRMRAIESTLAAKNGATFKE